jgi:DNA-binding beta-propeller fold protein YncE
LLTSPAATATHADATGLRPLRGALAAALAIALLGVLLCAASASATSGHRYSGQFSTPGSAPGELNAPAGLAIRQSTGDLWVVDAGNARVEHFDASGVFLDGFDGAATPATAFSSPQGIAVDQSSGDIYVADAGNNAVDVFDDTGAYVSQLDASGTPATVFSGPQGVAVDPVDGSVYVADTNNNVVDVFDDTGAFVSSFDGSSAPDASPFASPTQLAVDASHHVYVNDSGKGRLERYSDQGATFDAIFDSTSPAAVTADPTSDEVYVGENGPAGYQITHFTSAGDAVFTFGPPHIGTAQGLAVNATTGSVYVADSANSVIERFGTFVAPDVTTAAASGVDSADATLNGQVDPAGGGDITDCHFDYGTDTNYGNSVPCDQPVPISSATDVTAALSGLSPNTTYHYRLVAANASGQTAGGDQTFTTDAIAPTVDASAPFASSTSTTATLNATINPQGSDTSYHFVYGTDSSYGQSTPDTDGGASVGDESVSAEITGLVPDTVYHFAVVANNGTGGDIQGADAVFATAPAGAAQASDITATAATLSGTINPQGSAASYHFDYGTDTSYGQSTPETDGGSGTGDETVTSPVGGLEPDTSYHIRVVATINGQQVAGDDGTFTTVAAPSATLGAVTDITTNAATLHGSVDTHGLAGSYSFQVSGTNNPYSSATDPAPVPAAGGPVAVAATLGDLPSAGDYQVTLTVSAGGASGRSAPGTFATLAPPPFVAPTHQPDDPNPYGCVAPHIDQPGIAKPGLPLKVTGSDLGVAGQVTLGTQTIDPDSWTATGFTFTVPQGAKGTLVLSVNCTTQSNPVNLTIAKPSNAFKLLSAHAKRHAKSATLTLQLPGPGRVTLSGHHLKSVAKTVKAGSAKITLTLTSAGRKALHKRRTLKVRASVRFTPSGGSAATHTISLTFRR